VITLICDECGKQYKVKPYTLNLTKHHFCGSRCYGLWQRMHRIGVGRKRVIVYCDTCGKPIERVPSAVLDHSFCSKNCLNKWRSEYLSGENGSQLKGGHNDYRGPNWNEQREQVLIRDSFQCRHCNSTNDLVVHHVTPFHLFEQYLEANQIDNLITLCKSCHGVAEQVYYYEHPDAFANRILPITIRHKVCMRCGSIYSPHSPATKVCDSCCTFVCAYCGEVFVSRKLDRIPKYCSSACRNADIFTGTRICPDCGKSKHPDANRCRKCDTVWYRLHPEAPRRGRKPSH